MKGLYHSFIFILNDKDNEEEDKEGDICVKILSNLLSTSEYKITQASQAVPVLFFFLLLLLSILL